MTGRILISAWNGRAYCAEHAAAREARSCAFVYQGFREQDAEDPTAICSDCPAQRKARRALRPRDSQRRRVYRAEASPNNDRIIPAADIAPTIKAITSARWFLEAFGRLDLRVTISGRIGRKTAGYFHRGGLTFPRRGASMMTILHELAHAAAAQVIRSRNAAPEPGHGPTFAGVNLYIVEQVQGAAVAGILAARYRSNRVKVNRLAVFAARAAKEGV